MVLDGWAGTNRHPIHSWIGTLALVCALSCAESKPTEPVDTTPRTVMSWPGSRYVFGYDRMVGSYGDGETNIEFVTATDSRVITMMLLDRSTDASGLAFSVDGRPNIKRVEIGSVRTQGGEWLPLAFSVGPGDGSGYLSAERMRITTEGVKVEGSLRLEPKGNQPACDSNVRGTFWFTESAVGEADHVSVCRRDGQGRFAWTQIL